MATATLSQPPSFLKLLAHGLRWQLVEALARSDRRVQELVQLVGEPTNLVSYHLRQLRSQALVTEHRSAADGRDVYYSLDLDRMKLLYLATGESLHPGFATRPGAVAKDGETAPARRVRVLFLCTHNSARSQMAEAILRELGEDRVEAASAGTEVTRVHPLAVHEMADRGMDIRGWRSKHMNEFVGERFDYVVTVCDNARESCPIFPGDPERIHWSIPDPSAVEGEEKKRREAFKRAADELTTRIRYLLAMFEKKKDR
jgi:protein-tyrosine-phosphatase/DNA-binding transcriptional ArsR family regulator